MIKQPQRATSEPSAALARPKGGAKEEREPGVQVLTRAIEILRLLKSAPGGLSQAELAVQIGLARTTVHRIVNALLGEGMIEVRGGSSRYRIGAEILRMAEAARSALVTDVHPRLQSLSREIDETVDLSVLDRANVTFIDQVVALQRLRAVSVVGASFPSHCTAPGKAMLSTLSTAEVNRLLPEQLARLTPHTINSLSSLHAELEQVRASGVAFDREEHTLGIAAVGVAVRGTPLGLVSISVPIPAQRFAEKRDETVAALLRTARQIELEWIGDR
jgi:DNA-binding IclR family transcriptional regulator